MPTDRPGPATTPARQWLMTSGEVADLARVKRPVVTTWRRRHADFPQPVDSAGGSPLFAGHDIVDWLRDTGRGNAAPNELDTELALHSLTAWTSMVPPAHLTGFLTALLCLRRQLDRPVTADSWDTLLDIVEQLDSDDHYLLSELRAVPRRYTADLAVLADDLTEAAGSPARALDRVLDRHWAPGHPGEPSPLVLDALVGMSAAADLAPGSVLAVPDAGPGALLAALHDAGDPDHVNTFLAAEPDPAAARLTRRRMLARGIDEFRLHVADGPDPAVDDFGDPDVLLHVLPYRSAEHRDPVAVLERVESDTDLLGPDRVAVVLGPADVLLGPLEPHGRADRLRRRFLADGLLKATVALPDTVFGRLPGYRAAVWVLARTAPERRHGLVLVTDLSTRPLSRETVDSLVLDVGIWRDAGWTVDRRHEPRTGVVSTALSMVERPGSALVAHGASLARRYTRTVTERPARIEELRRRVPDGADLVRRGIVVARPDSAPVRRVTVNRLVTERRLTRRPGHRIAAAHLTPTGHYPVLGPAELLDPSRIGARRIDRDVLFTEYEHVGFTEPGDIVVTDQPRFGAHLDVDGLSVVVFPARVLRVLPEALLPVRPRVLVALLRAAAAEQTASAGTVRTARRVGDLIVPDLDPAEADRIEALLTDLDHRRTRLRDQLATLEDLGRLTVAGLYDGTLTIADNPEGTDHHHAAP